MNGIPFRPVRFGFNIEHLGFQKDVKLTDLISPLQEDYLCQLLNLGLGDKEAFDVVTTMGTPVYAGKLKNGQMYALEKMKTGMPTVYLGQPGQLQQLPVLSVSNNGKDQTIETAQYRFKFEGKKLTLFRKPGIGEFIGDIALLVPIESNHH